MITFVGTIANYWRWQEGWLITNEDYEQRFNATLPHGYNTATKVYNGTAIYTLENLKVQ